MDAAQLFRRTAATLNRVTVQPLLHTGVGQRVFGSWMTELTYTGRKSGRRVTVPVGYRRDRSTGEVVVLVAAPQAKTWWRNFTGDGGPLRVRIRDVEHDGHARVVRDGGKVTVRIRLG